MDNYTYELILSDNHIKAGKIDIPVNFKDKFNIKFAYWALMDINGIEYKVYIQEKGQYYDPEFGVLDKFADNAVLKRFLKIML